MKKYIHRPLHERFWDKVNKATLTGCWEWTGALLQFVARKKTDW